MMDAWIACFVKLHWWKPIFKVLHSLLIPLASVSAATLAPALQVLYALHLSFQLVDHRDSLSLSLASISFTLWDSYTRRFIGSLWLLFRISFARHISSSLLQTRWVTFVDAIYRWALLYAQAKIVVNLNENNTKGDIGNAWNLKVFLTLKRDELCCNLEQVLPFWIF